MTTAGVVPDCASYNEKVLARFKERGAPDYAIVSHRGTNYDAVDRGARGGTRGDPVPGHPGRGPGGQRLTR